MAGHPSFSSAEPIREMINRQHAGQPSGIYSICSAHREVLRTAMRLHKESGQPLLIEATCNQVNQEGGYTGLTPSRFADYVRGLAVEVDLPPEQIILGGDHLGPNPWRKEAAETAMDKAERMVHAYAAAGYAKIHLDASMPCGGEQPPSTEEIAQRTARLCARCEEVYAGQEGGQLPVYVIGTEVPLPGGLTIRQAEGAHVTAVADVQETLDVHRQIFSQHGLESALERVVAVVVSPGVEFGNTEIYPYEPAKTSGLRAFIERRAGMVYEAHSTDYQPPQALRRMVADHFAILKVGPALTFAYREALFNLAAIENELPWIAPEDRSRIVETLLEAMQADPRHWREHYAGAEREVQFALKYSFSDRSRYYWNCRPVRAALDKLMANLSASEIPLALVSQFFPASYEAVYEGKIKDQSLSLSIAEHPLGKGRSLLIKSSACELVQAGIRRALAGYPAAYSSIIA